VGVHRERSMEAVGFVELLAAPATKRRWADEAKGRMVAETLVSGVTVIPTHGCLPRSPPSSKATGKARSTICFRGTSTRHAAHDKTMEPRHQRCRQTFAAERTRISARPGISTEFGTIPKTCPPSHAPRIDPAAMTMRNVRLRPMTVKLWSRL